MPAQTINTNLQALRNLLSDRLHALPMAIICITDKCNSRCIACDYWRFGKTQMSLDLAHRLAQELPARGTRYVLLSGGEPLQHPNWDLICRAFKDAGIRLGMVTSGILLPKYLDKIASCLDELFVSLDGATPESYEAIRGVDGFGLVEQGVRALAGTLPLTVRTTVQKLNYGEIPHLIRLSRRWGASHHSFLAVDVTTQAAFGRQGDFSRSMALRLEDLEPFSRVLDEVEIDFQNEFEDGFILETPEKLRNLHAYFSALLGVCQCPEIRCNAPRFSVVIGAEGSLRPCYFLPVSAAVDNTPILDSLNLPGAVSLRRQQRLGEREECARCVCPAFRSARRILGGL